MARLTAIGRMMLLAYAVLAGPAWADRLLEAFDLPLMAGMVLDPEQSLLFDSPEGRVIEAVATGPVPASALRAFYKETLPMLGWHVQPTENNEDSEVIRFHRAGERLELHVNSLADGTRLRLTLAPE